MQVIEVFIRSEEGLSRDMVKHLNVIEEQVLESRAWSKDSALWEALENDNSKVPTVAEVWIHQSLCDDHIVAFLLGDVFMFIMTALTLYFCFNYIVFP